MKNHSKTCRHENKNMLMLLLSWHIKREEKKRRENYAKINVTARSHFCLNLFWIISNKILPRGHSHAASVHISCCCKSVSWIRIQLFVFDASLSLSIDILRMQQPSFLTYFSTLLRSLILSHTIIPFMRREREREKTALLLLFFLYDSQIWIVTQVPHDWTHSYSQIHMHSCTLADNLAYVTIFFLSLSLVWTAVDVMVINSRIHNQQFSSGGEREREISVLWGSWKLTGKNERGEKW